MKNFSLFLVIHIIFFFSGCTETQEFFHEKLCISSECTEEKSGYFWATKNKITIENECNIGFTQGFINGCIIFITENNQRELATPLPEKTLDEEFVFVKYRKSGAVNIKNPLFQSIEHSDETVKNAWYDSSQSFLLIQLGKTVYQYCRVPEETWDILSFSEEPYIIYQEYIRGRFDCRKGGEAFYK